MADEKAVKELSMAKGASGTKICLMCQNLVKTQTALPPGSRLVDFACCDWTRICQHDHASIMQVWNYLRDVTATVTTQQAAKDISQAAGFNYSEYGLLSGPMAGVSNIPHSIYWDWMHTVVASGGVAQYELNQLLRRISTTIPLVHLDAFAKLVNHPARLRPPKMRFEKRVRNSSGAHINAFASETLHIMDVVKLFCDAMGQQLEHLRDELKCFGLLFRIVQLLRQGRIVGERLRLLRLLVLKHHTMFVELYPACVKPKLHYLFHIPECIALFGIVMSCFCPERKHRKGKHIGHFAFRQYCDTITRRVLRSELDAHCKPETVSVVAAGPIRRETVDE